MTRAAPEIVSELPVTPTAEVWLAMSPKARELHIEQVIAALQREEAWALEGAARQAAEERRTTLEQERATLEQERATLEQERDAALARAAALEAELARLRPTPSSGS